MRILKILLAVLFIQLTISCSKSNTELSLAGNWKVTSAVGNDNRQWNGTFTLAREGNSNVYTGLFLWNTIDNQATGTDSITGTYNPDTKVLIMQSVVISGNIESVLYTMDVTDNGTKMTGIWTGSSDGTVAHPGRWSAEKQ